MSEPVNERAVDYSGALLKVERAKAHLAELDYAVFRYLRTKPYRISVVHDFETGQAGFEIALKEDPPVGLALLIGDTVHNLRSTLDHIVSACAIARGRTPKGTYFPISQTRDGIEAVVKEKARKAGERALQVCLDLKPYPGGYDALVSLNELDLVDKHRLLVGVAAAGHLRGRYLHRLGQPQIRVDAPVYFLGDQVQHVPAPPSYEGEVPFEMGFAVDVVFPANGPQGGDPCVATLYEFADIVGEIVALFQRDVATVTSTM